MEQEVKYADTLSIIPNEMLCEAHNLDSEHLKFWYGDPMCGGITQPEEFTFTVDGKSETITTKRYMFDIEGKNNNNNALIKPVYVYGWNPDTGVLLGSSNAVDPIDYESCIRADRG